MITEDEKMMAIDDDKDDDVMMMNDGRDCNNNENEGYVLVDSLPPPSSSLLLETTTTSNTQETTTNNNTGSSEEDIIKSRRRKDWKKRMLQQRKRLPPRATKLTFPKIIKTPSAFFCCRAHGYDSSYGRACGWRFLFHGILQILWSICRSWIIWQLLVLLLNTTTPIVVLLTDQITTQRNDFLILNNWTQDFHVGDITTFQIKDRHLPKPITHRIIKKVYMNNTIHYLTKGDDNRVDDLPLLHVPSLHREDFLGKVIIRIPHIGLLSIFLTDYPLICYIWVLKLALSILFLAGNGYYNTANRQAVKWNSWKLSVMIFVIMWIQGW